MFRRSGFVLSQLLIARVLARASRGSRRESSVLLHLWVFLGDCLLTTYVGLPVCVQPDDSKVPSRRCQWFGVDFGRCLKRAKALRSGPRPHRHRYHSHGAES
ncbi:hypothetical protein LY78DRAFT_655093 [Colletotrichum sublineola]|nr:hypothetical protein LY78DRAFT_655093 [Colletotrichum sublineola]